jgi:glycosyltransferase involved in cell wall biosynthesis
LDRKLSVVVPAYHENATISKNLLLLDESLRTLGRPYEIIVVCDGCTDTKEAADKVPSPNLTILHYDENMGKGYALKYGAARTTGDLVTFIDADMNIDPHQIDIFIKLMDVYDADIVIG